jgi:hypothetical protein
MINAYTTAYPIEEDTYRLPDSKGGLSPVVGFTRPPSSRACRAWPASRRAGPACQQGRLAALFARGEGSRLASNLHG